MDRSKSRKVKPMMWVVLIAAIIVVLVVGVIVTARVAAVRMAGDITLEPVNISQVASGTYTGRAESPIVKATVQVTVEGGVITDVRIVEHFTGMGKPAEALAQTIEERQSLDLDAVSGATLSSKVILKAAENALEQGLA
jgi:uncharacterized protein with FMN-binding domain